MIPIGVFGHPAPTASQARSQKQVVTKKPKTVVSRRANLTKHFAFTKSSDQDQGRGPFPLRADSKSAAEKRQRNSPAKTGSRKIIVPGHWRRSSPSPQPRRVDSALSVHGEAHSDQNRLSWRGRAQRGHLQARARHVEIIVPPWVRSPSLPSPPRTPESGICRISEFPTPPSVLAKIDGVEESNSVLPADTLLVDAIPRIAPLKDEELLASPNRPRHKMNGSAPSPPKSELASRDQNFFDSRPVAEQYQNKVVSPQSMSVPMSTNTPANNLSSLVCNVHRTTGERPPALVGASTTICGDRLYVFGGRRLSRRKTQLTQDLYELNLISRHWIRLQTNGEVPPPRYFHSCCAIGDTKLVSYGGMAPSTSASNDQSDSTHNNETPQAEPGIGVASDTHIYDIASRTWTAVSIEDAPTGRYAHCAAVVPSSSFYTSETAKIAGTASSPASPNPDSGRGGAEMIVIGGQDGASRYIEQISIFNLRSLKWVSTINLAKSCGAYRSVVMPITTMRYSQIGSSTPEKNGQRQPENDEDDTAMEQGFATLIYSNYNFLDVKLELQIRLPNGNLDEKSMMGNHSPPGLRFPNGDIIGHHFVVSGTFLTSSKQEYALWALDLKSLTWSRIDTGPGILTSGSWNRGVLWKKRNTFVILGDRRRSLSEDYNHRRLNFSNICNVELEAFGLYDNPITTTPLGYASHSSPPWERNLLTKARGPVPALVASTLGRSVSDIRETADMDFLAIGGERIPVNSYIAIRRWGPHLVNLLEKNITSHEQGLQAPNGRPSLATQTSRNSSITITPGSVNSFSNSMNDAFDSISARTASPAATLRSGSSKNSAESAQNVFSLRPSSRSRVLYLPHTHLTIRALVYYLYTWSLPPPATPLCSLQILCSLLQLARPYGVNGLLEATVERLHQVLDGRNTAAIFNAAAMAAGGGDSVAFAGDLSQERRQTARASSDLPNRDLSTDRASSDVKPDDSEDDIASNVSSSTTSLSGAESPRQHHVESERIWTGEFSSVVGLQKRGLRGLMEGRKLRERSNGEEVAGQNTQTPVDTSNIGLGIG